VLNIKRTDVETEQKVIDLYFNENLSSVEIGKILNLGCKTVQRIIKRNGFETRTLSASQFAKINKEPDIRLFDKDWLQEQHLIKNKTCKDIGKELGVDAGTVRRHMKKLGISTKTNSESKVGLMVGENHPNWKGGISPLKLLLREYTQVNIAPMAAKRDNYTCQLCGKSHTVLHAHHIIPFNNIYGTILSEHPELDKNNPSDIKQLYDIFTHDDRFLSVDNLIIYCKDCHFYKIHKYKKKIISSQASNIEEGSETIL